MCDFRVFLDGTRRFLAPHAPLRNLKELNGGACSWPVPTCTPHPPENMGVFPVFPCSPCSSGTRGTCSSGPPPPPGAWKVQQLPHTLSPAHWVGTVHTSHHVPCAYPPPRLHAALVPRGHAGKEQVGTGLNDASLGAPCASRAPERGSSPARPKVPPNMRTSAPFLSPNAPHPHPRREGTRQGTY